MRKQPFVLSCELVEQSKHELNSDRPFNRLRACPVLDTGANGAGSEIASAAKGGRSNDGKEGASAFGGLPGVWGCSL
ncbi:MAG: hypothetical protein WC749_06325 [Dehalococcoidia bacterium]